MTNHARRLAAAVVLGLALGAAGTHAVAQQAPEAKTPGMRALNPQPEVPSKPGAPAAKGATALNPSAKPAAVTNPKALNPQPEVPSKPAKKVAKKKRPDAAKQ